MQRSIDDLPFTSQRIQTLAERDPKRAVRLARRALESLRNEGEVAQSWAIYTLGWALLCWERFDQARPHLQAARAAFAAAGQDRATLFCDYALALADLFQRLSPDLEPTLATLADQLEQAGEPTHALRAQFYRALLLDILGRPSDAVAALEQLAPAVAHGRPLDQARWDYVRGALTIAHADFAAAEQLLAQAERAFQRLRSPLERAQCSLQLGWAALRQERLEAALTAYRRAARAFARLELPVRAALCDRGLGFTLSRMGRYDEALSALLKAQRVFASLQRVGDIGVCQLNLGSIYFYTGQWPIALAHYRRADALFAAAGAHSQRIIVKRDQAMVYRAQQRRDDAAQLLAEAEAQARQIGDQAELAETWSEQAGLLADAGRYHEAVLRYQQARDLFLQLDSDVDAAECAAEQGWLALRQGDRDRAGEYFHAAATALAAHPYYRWRTDYGLARCAELRGDLAAALQHYRTANATVAALRRRLASAAASSGIFVQAEQLYRHALALAAAVGAREDALGFSESQRALALQRALVVRLATPSAEEQGEIQALQAHIAALLAADDADAAQPALEEALASYADLLLRARHSAPAEATAGAAEVAFDLARLRAQLTDAYGADWTALAYSVSDTEMLISAVTPDDLALESIPYDATLRRLIDRAGKREYRISTYRDLPYFMGDTERPWDDLRTLADRLLPAAVQARLHPQHRLLIVPAGPLHSILWAALRLGDQWLAERAIVQLTPSLTIWQAVAARSAPRRTDALLVGCSAFGDRADPLPAVPAELQAIAERWLGESRRLEDAQATRAALRERSAAGDLARCGLLHIASHAQLLPNRGIAAHLKLWDGDLWIDEIASLRLDGALVTLSACDGALADALPGEELLSVTWAFLAAGAGSVVASLWPIDDQRILRLMTAFYEALQRDGDAGRALAEAQRALILQHDISPDPATEPLTWGSFVFVGGAQRFGNDG